MTKIMDKIKKNKEFSIIMGATILVAIATLVVVLVFVIGKKEDEKTKLTNELEKIGRNYYEEYYYVSAGNDKEENSKANYLKNFESVGLKINLENLLRYNNTLKDKNTTKFVNSKTNKKCNYEKSMVTIYPKKPFGKKDYKISVYLDCGFKEEK